MSFFKTFLAVVLSLALTQVVATPIFFNLNFTSASGATFTDSFVRGNANPMTDPASGGTWTSGDGSMNDCQIIGNQLRGTSSSGYNGARVLTPTFANNQSASVVMVTLSQYVGPRVRIQGTTNDSCYILWTNASNSIIQVRKIATDGTSTTQIGADITVTTGTGASGVLAAGDILRLDATGTTTTTLKAYVNGTQNGTDRTDSSSALTGGQPGVFIFDTGVTIGQFVANDI